MKLPKGAVITRDGLRFEYKGRSYPLITMNDKLPVKNESKDMQPLVNELNKLFSKV